ncbi:prepilin-type N-terminal cleavage/methylation domain-containing protein [Alienimonas sp. DA493]|uniref:prepilin-type N-terminal cleavage/methylation domain-containing protein n=1 Tax=Alienimonas sp. DA493 TaxID=3373605 RepID=UPI0037547D51
MNSPGPPTRRTAPARRGFTLVEVLAGLALLGTLLAALLVADAAQGRQAARAADRLAAVRALDALLTGWAADADAALPPAPGGPLTADGRLVWSARRERRPGAAALGCVVLRVEARRDAAAGDGRPVASVELLVVDEVRGAR